MSSAKDLVPGPMTALDRLSLSWLVPLTIARTLLTFASRSADSSSLQWRQKLSISLLQALRRTLNPRHIFAHSRRRLTGAAVEAYCRAHGGLAYAAVVADPPGDPFADSAAAAPPVPPPTLHIVTPADAPADGPTLLYAHGGGYLNPLQAPGHMPFALRCAAACGAARLVVVEYALTSERAYPAQLVQVVAATGHLLSRPLPGAAGAAQDDRGVRPGDLILAGDSAGGHLVASLLAHVARPSPHAPPLAGLLGPEAGGQLRAVALFSPWTGMTTADASFTANHETDYLSARQMDVFIRLLGPPASPAEVWASPIESDDAAAVWRAAFPRAPSGGAAPLARRMLVTSGAAETLFDSCVKFARELLGADMVVLDSDDKVALVAGKELVFTVAPDEAHVQPVLDSALGCPNGRSMRAIEEFLQSTKQ